MKLVEISCPSCGANIHVEEDTKSVKCAYCQKEFFVDDEVKKVQHSVTNAAQAGYDFERGRIKAAQDEMYWQQQIQRLGYDPRVSRVNGTNGTGQNAQQPPKKHILLKIILWVLFFPIMAVYTVMKSKRFDTETKVFILII